MGKKRELAGWLVGGCCLEGRLASWLARWLLAACQSADCQPGLSSDLLSSGLLAGPRPTGWGLLAAQPAAQLHGWAVHLICFFPFFSWDRAVFVILSFKMAPWLPAVVALDCCLAALWLVASWVVAWLADQPAGRLAAGWLAPVLPRCPSGLLAGQRVNWRSGPLMGWLLAACPSGLSGICCCIFPFRGHFF